MQTNCKLCEVHSIQCVYFRKKVPKLLQTLNKISHEKLWARTFFFFLATLIWMSSFNIHTIILWYVTRLFDQAAVLVLAHSYEWPKNEYAEYLNMRSVFVFIRLYTCIPVGKKRLKMWACFKIAAVGKRFFPSEVAFVAYLRYVGFP